MLPQMRENDNFPIAISQYLTLTKVTDMIGDGYVLLVDIFT